MMTKRPLKMVWLLFMLSQLISCQQSDPDDALDGRVTLWHSWSEEEAVVLEQALDQFQEVHPDVRIVSVALPQDQLLDEFKKSGNNGLGPALMIGSDSWIGELSDDGLIRSFIPDSNTSILFNSRNRALVQNREQVFGIPLSLAPNALYYNKNLVTEPPETLDELLQDAANGNRIAFVPRFEKAYWGIQTFGVGLFDADNQFTLADSGFTEWLRWLDGAQHAPGVILNVDDASLLELFTSGEVAYYVAGPDKQTLIASKIDPENPFEYGVAPLPSGPEGASGPLLSAETILLYAFTSAEQTRIANALASFLVNQQQSIRFMRELDRVPSNATIAVDRRIYPIVSGFSRQTKTAVVIPNEIPSLPLIRAGDRAYVSVLSGVLSPEEAVCQFGLEVAAFQNYTATEMDLPQDCLFPSEE